MLWSLLRAAAPAGVRGLTTEATFGAFATAAAAAFTASAFFGSVSLPVEAWITIGLVPFACAGNERSRVSVAFWLSVPGSDRLSLVFSPSAFEAPTAATVSTSQRPSTRSRRRTQKCATR